LLLRQFSKQNVRNNCSLELDWKEGGSRWYIYIYCVPCECSSLL